jgi:hypothetical protein
MATLFSTLLGDAFDRLPPRVRALHAAIGSRTYRGSADIERGSGFLSQIMGMATSLPPRGRQLPTTVTIETSESTERWSRNFDGHWMRSNLSNADGLLRETLGLATFRFRLTVENDVLTWHVASVRSLGIPLPARWFAGVIAREFEIDGRYHFDVRAELPLVGLLVHYRGALDVG